MAWHAGGAGGRGTYPPAPSVVAAACVPGSCCSAGSSSSCAPTHARRGKGAGRAGMQRAARGRAPHDSWPLPPAPQAAHAAAALTHLQELGTQLCQVLGPAQQVAAKHAGLPGALSSGSGQRCCTGLPTAQQASRCAAAWRCVCRRKTRPSANAVSAHRNVARLAALRLRCTAGPARQAGARLGRSSIAALPRTQARAARPGSTGGAGRAGAVQQHSQQHHGHQAVAVAWRPARQSPPWA